ncbi:MAG: hypothetical protein QM734_12770 [Cyclobacteriaceae bacterium]
MNIYRANIIFLLLLIFLIYVFADNDTNGTGIDTYFVIYSLIALPYAAMIRLPWGFHLLPSD